MQRNSMDKTGRDVFIGGLWSVLALWCLTCSTCDATTFTGSSGVFQSPDYPTFRGGSDCIWHTYGRCYPYCTSFRTWLISTSSHKSITLSFDDFNVPRQGWCCPNYVEITDDATGSGNRLASFCGTSIPDPVTSTGSTMHIKLAATDSTPGVGFKASWNTSCASKFLQSNSGVIQSPRFPNPPDEDEECRWTISVDHGQIIHFDLQTIAVGPESAPSNLPCNGISVTTQLALYDSESAVESKLMKRYCTRHEQPERRSTTGNHLTIVFTSRNTQNETRSSSPQHGFNATYSTGNGSSGVHPGLLLHGSPTRDPLLTPKASHSGAIILGNPTDAIHGPGMPINDSFPQYAHVHRDGKISFANSENDNNFNRNYICVFCTKIRQTEHGAAVYYNFTDACDKEGADDKQTQICGDAENQIRDYTEHKHFNASRILWATWIKVENQKKSFAGKASFQAAVVSDGDRAYALLYYREGAMKWTTSSEDTGIDIGVGISSQFRRNPYSFTKEALQLDKFMGNSGRRGVWIYSLGDTPPTPEQECAAWYRRNEKLRDERREGFDRLPKCPCRERRMEEYGSWERTSTEERKQGRCYRLNRARSRNLFPYGLLCCYNINTGSFNSDAPAAGSALAFNPVYSSLSLDHNREDRQAYHVCCEKASSAHCNKFYELRPAAECDPNLQYRFSWMCCDPHITTLDEGEYVFNGWGEYTMVSINTPNVTFTLQGRAELVDLQDGKQTNATVFTAFGAEENGVKVFVGLEPVEKSSLIIYADGRDYSLHFENRTNFVEDTDDFTLARVNDSLVVSFPSGTSIAASVRIKSLAASVSLPLTFRNQTRGLLGNFNGNKDDDFILPDGTFLPNDLTEREIFENFGKHWQVTDENSVMRYGPREGPADYAHPEFTPVFLDEQPAEVRQAAVAICGSANLACIYDYVATANEAFAKNSKQFQEQAAEIIINARNTVPLLNVPSTLYVNSGTQQSFMIDGQDPDTDETLSYHVVDDADGSVQVNSVTGQVTYFPDVFHPVDLRFYAVDSHNAQSPTRIVAVEMCSGCSGHGTCDQFLHSKDSSFSFRIRQCICEPAWDGPHCELDRDGCAGNPCMPQQTCRDLTPEEQGQNEIGYDCGPCPAGFERAQGSQECVDFDECSDENDCSMNCINTEGSYVCSCDSGYRLGQNGRACWDVNECLEKTDDCEHICINTIGSYSCLCEEGYTLNSSDSSCTQDESTASICSNAGCSEGCKSAGNTVPECFCPKGYDLDLNDNKTCLDHDECQDGVCPQQCYNYDGGFACFCYGGFRLSDDKRTCEPCPPLRYGIDCQLTCNCHGQFEACDPVRGCVCNPGFTGNFCQYDIDECSENPSICDSDQICSNTIGSYSCSCREGYSLDSNGDCADINECAEESLLNTCGSLQQCVNLPGSFYCTCNEGYMTINDSCTDVDECSGGSNECEQICINALGTYNCDCHYGYRLNQDRVSCAQVLDACAVEKNLTCEHGCTLSDGDDQATCFCRTGFQLRNDQKTCHDIDECTSGTAGCSHQCTNTNGGFICSCPVGMKLDNDRKTCLNCTPGTYGSYCTGTCGCGIASKRCDVITGLCDCKEGWQGERCDADVNECDTEVVDQECRDKNAVCVNYPGGYRCRCEVGYEVDGSGVCRDIDECVSTVCEQTCENSPGSYRCLCNKGFTLDSNTGKCKDLDECNITATNNCTQLCLNTIGSYFCACDIDGYVLDNDGVACTSTIPCERADCPKENGGCDKNECFCNSGYKLIRANNTCVLEEVNWCVDYGCDHFCEETLGGASFVCSCRPGYILQEDGTTCGDCPSDRYGPDCKDVCTCNMQKTQSCDKETGACTCKSGWAGSTCDDDIDECTASPGVTCTENSHCVNNAGSYLCSCDSGYYKTSGGRCVGCTSGFYGKNCASRCDCSENVESQTCNGVTGDCMCQTGWDGARCDHDIDECMTEQHDCRGDNMLCVNEEGGFRCVCEGGWTMVESPKRCFVIKRLRVTFIVSDISVSEDDLTDLESPTYLYWKQSAIQAITNQLGRGVSRPVTVEIVFLRVGSLIIVADIVVDQNSITTQELSLAIFKMVDTPLTVGSQTGTLTILVNDTDVDSSWTTCDVYEAFESCPAGQKCNPDDQQLPHCSQVDAPSTPTSNLLLIVLGVTIPLVILVIIGIVIWKVKHKKSRTKAYSDSTVFLSDLPSRSQTPQANARNVPPTSYVNPALYGDSGLISEDYIKLDQSAMADMSPYERLRPTSATPNRIPCDSWTRGFDDAQQVETRLDGGTAPPKY